VKLQRGFVKLGRIYQGRATVRLMSQVEECEPVRSGLAISQEKSNKGKPGVLGRHLSRNDWRRSKKRSRSVWPATQNRGLKDCEAVSDFFRCVLQYPQKSTAADKTDSRLALWSALRHLRISQVRQGEFPARSSEPGKLYSL
jgi:hypothetical protein